MEDQAQAKSLKEFDEERRAVEFRGETHLCLICYGDVAGGDFEVPPSVIFFLITIAHRISHGTNVVVVNSQSAISKIFCCYLFGCLQQHLLCGIFCGLC